MKRKIIAFLFLFLFIFSSFAPLTVHAKNYEFEDSLTSDNVAVFNTDKGFIVYGKNEHVKAAPGSTVKIMTAIIALEYFENRLDTVLTVPAAALRGLEGSAVLSLKADEQISVIDLIHATLVAGMNDAANTLAFAIGGTMQEFVKIMNAKAAEMGAFNTLYANATGLESSALAYTTAYDAAKIASYVYENKLFMEICSKRTYQIAQTNFHESVTIYTKNSFLTPKSDYYYKYAEGICTSYSNAGGAQLVCASSNGNNAYICVALGSKKDENGNIPGYAEVKSLLSWASSNFAERKVLDKSQIICELPVRAGKDVAHVLVVPYQSVYAFLDKDTDLSLLTFSEELYYEKLDAPVQKGDCVGTLTILMDGIPIGATFLITKASVRQSSAGQLLLFFEKLFSNKLFITAVLLSLLFFSFKIYLQIKRKKKRRR